jgi:beta-lactamase regulating signal transducer with metallopeptidase domain
MQHLLQFGLSNAAAATVLAVLAAVATRVWRNPHLAYALWFVVLLRLVAPPLLPVALPVPQWMAESFREPLPAESESETAVRPPVDDSSSVARSTGGPELPPVAPETSRPNFPGRARDVGGSELVAQAPFPEDRGDPEGAPPRGSSGVSRGVSKDVSQSSATRRPSIANLVAAVWLSGTLCYLLLTTVRVRRFARVLRRARRDVPAGIAAEAANVAAAVGLRRVPRLAFAKVALPPMVWPGWRPVVLLPEALFTSLGPGERRLLLWHEFLHLRRRDHLVRWFEVFVVGLYWWNPIGWWAVARLQRAEEDCCDAAVLVAHPQESARYGETLVSVAQFLSAGTLPTPSLSVGVARNRHIKKRLTMILQGPRWPELSKTRLAAFSLLGAALVAVTWTAAKAQTAPATPAVSAASPSSSSKTEEAPIADVIAKLPQEGERIDEILVEGNVTIPTATILQKMKTQTGLKATPSMVQEDLRTLIKTRWFFSVVPKYRRTDKKLILVLSVVERPMIHSVTYLGATQIKLKKLAAETALKVGSPYDMGANKEAARHLETFYHEQGYTEATVDLVKGDKPADRDVIFRIHEGACQKVIWRYFAGNDSVSSERLSMVLKSTPAYGFIRGKFDPANLTEDVAAVRKYYADLGFFDATVTPTVEYRHNREWIYLKYTVHEGRHYKIRNVSMTGNVHFKTNELLRLTKTYEGQFYDAFQIRKDLEKFKKKYVASGFEPVNVELVPHFPGQLGLIDLSVRVSSEIKKVQWLPSAPPRALNVDTKAAAASRLLPTVPVPEKRDVPLSQIKPMQPAPGDDELRKLQKERYNAALRELQLYEIQDGFGAPPRISEKCKASRTFYDAWKVLAKSPAEELQAVDWYVGYTNRLWKQAYSMLMAGGVTASTPFNEAESRAAHLEAQIESMKLRQRLASKSEGGIREAILRDLKQGAAATKRSTASATQAPSPASDKATARAVEPPAPTPRSSAATAGANGRALPRLLTASPVAIGPADGERLKLLKERYNAALRLLRATYKRHEIDPATTVTIVVAAARRMLAADLALASDPVAVCDRYLEFTKSLEREAEARFKARMAGQDELEAAHEARLDAELELLEAKSGKAAPPNWVPSGPPAT